MLRSFPLFGSLTALLWATTSLAQTLPTGGSVVAGSATISRPSATQMTVNQGSDSAIVNWDGFSVGSGARLDFHQPSSRSVILNRVTGSTTSEIHGQLNANGQVHLVNPNGIYIGPNGQVSAAGFVASTLAISNDDFLSGALRYNGNGKSAAVENAGTISIVPGGYAALIGGRVSNSGVIRVPLGKVGLGAGERVTLDISGDGFLQVAVPSDSDDGSMRALVSNSGRIEADGGTVQLMAASARDAARQVVNMSGVIEARSVGGVSGAVVLGGSGGAVRVTGRIDTSARVTLVESSPRPAVRPENGGAITITGEAIELAGATLDATGAGAGSGGTIRVGGDYQGRGDLQNADTTRVDANTRLIADGGSQGDGGTVILWSDGFTGFAGDISARGGSEAGDGGLVEVSGKAHLAFAGNVDTRAPNGATGTLLLDPYNITIVNGAGNDLWTEDLGAYFPTGDDSEIPAANINNSLTTTNVVISTDNDGQGTQAGNITVDADLSWNTGFSLSLFAENNILVRNGTITATGDGSLFLNAAGNIDTLADISVATGTLSMTAGGTILNFRPFIVDTGVIDLTAATIDLRDEIRGGTGSTLNITATTGNVGIRAPISGGFSTITFDSPLTISTGALNFDQEGTIDVDGATIGMTASQVTIDSAITAPNSSLSLVGTNGVTITANIDATNGSIGASGAGTVVVDGDLTIGTGSLSISPFGGLTVNGDISAGTGATIGLSTAGTAIVTGNIIAPNASTISLSGDSGLSVTGATISAAGADLSFDSADSSVLITSNIIAADADISFDAQTTLETRGTITAPEADISYFSGGQITVSGGISAPDTDPGDTASIDFFTQAGQILLQAPVLAPDAELSLWAAAGTSGSSPIVPGVNADIDVASFVLSVGDWRQVGAGVADFSADNFELGFQTDRRSFLRALGGDGSDANPYRLFDIYGLQGIEGTGDGDPSYEIVNDINASGTSGWNDGSGFMPIELFDGTLNGNRHAIDGLFIDTFDFGGLFAELSGTVLDLRITNADVSSSFGGILAGYNFGTVIGVMTSGSYLSYDGTGGGLVGYNFGTISDSYSTADVTVETSEGGFLDAGGLAGVNDGTIQRSHSSGSVFGETFGSIFAGGLVGTNFGLIQDSYSTANVQGVNFSTSDVTVLGGLVGGNYTGEGGDGTISRSFSTGSLTATTSGGTVTRGGLVGENFGTVSNSFWDRQSSGQATSAGGTPLTTAELQNTQGFYDRARALGWDFMNVWAPGSSGFYPANYSTSPVVFAIPNPVTVQQSNVPTATTTGTVYGGPSIYRFYLAPDSLNTSPIFASLAFASDAVGTTDYAVDTGGLSSANGQPYRVAALEGTATITPDPVPPPEPPEEPIIEVPPQPQIQITPTIDTTIGGGGTVTLPVEQARAALQTIEEASTDYEERITDCSSQGEDVSQYLSCLADATAEFAADLDAITEGLPPGLDNVADIIRDASAGIRAVGEDAGRRLALATTVEERAAIRREAGLQARDILRGAQQEIRKEIALIRAEDPELASVQRQQVETVVAAVQKAEIGLSRAIGL